MLLTGWEFLFTMKQNEYFVFPNEETGFDPSEIDLLDPTNYAKISPNLFRVQKLTSGDFWFRHHLETQIDVNPLLKEITFKRIGLSSLKNIEKIRVDHLGKIISVDKN